MTVQLLKMRSTSSDRPCSNDGSMVEVCKTSRFTEKGALDRGEFVKRIALQEKINLIGMVKRLDLRNFFPAKATPQ